MVMQILVSNVLPLSTTLKCHCLVCFGTVPQTNASSKTEKVGVVFSNLFKVLCHSMKWSPPNKYQLNFRTDPFPFCQKCRLTVVKLLKNHQLLKEIQDRIDRLTFELCGKILESQNEKSARSLDQEFRTPRTACERNSFKGTANIWEKTKYYRNVIINRYLPSVKLTVDALDTDSTEEKINEGQRFESATADEIDVTADSDFGQSVEGHRNISHDEGDHGDQQLEFAVQDVANNERSEILDHSSRSTRKTRRKTLNDLEAVEERIDDFEDLLSENNEDSDYKPDVLPACEESSDEDSNSLEINYASELKKCAKEESTNTKYASTEKCQKDDANEEDRLFVGVDHPFRSLRDRVKKVGDYQFLLDDKFPFEFSNNRWRCISCNARFKQKAKLRYHLNFCPGPAPKGEDVEKTFKYRKCMYDKLRSGQLRCRHCTCLCSSSDEIMCHMQKFHVGKLDSQSRYKPWYVEIEPKKYMCSQNFPFEFLDETFKCGTCETSSTAISEILSHIQKEHISLIPGARREFIFCESTGPGKFLMNGEFAFEKTGRGDEFQCNDCLYSCQRLRTMKDHIKCKHIDVQRFCCDTCGKKFGAKPSLIRHQKIHGKDRPFDCELCGKSFKLQEGLRVHQASVHIRSSLKKFICETCGKYYSSMTVLRAHAKSHELVMCEACGKQVSNGVSLRFHLETHKQETYACKKCGKKFQHSSSLYMHLKSHDGAKPYSCDICGMKFTQHYSVTRHIKVVHTAMKADSKSRKRKLGETTKQHNDGSEKSIGTGTSEGEDEIEEH